MVNANQQLTFEDLKNREIELRILSPERLFEIADASLVVDLGREEDSRFERKRAAIGPRELGDYFSMWSNTQQGGLIVVGQEDRGELLGVLSLSTKDINKIEEAAHTYCPDAAYESKKIYFTRSDGTTDYLFLFFVRYHESRVVRTSNNKIYVRRGDSKYEVRKEEEIRLLREEKNEISAELESVNLGWPQDFDIVAIDDWVTQVVSKGGLTPEYQEREGVLADNYLGKQTPDGFVPNLACALLFANRPRSVVPGARVHFFRFDGKEQGTGTKWNATKDEFVEGTIPSQIAGCANVLRSQLRTFSRFESEGKFDTAPEYPEEAWYEALVNACVHRTYSNGLRNVAIEIRMFDDRLEVQSPGPLPPLVTPKNIYDTHNPRNPHLMSAMRFMGFVKMAREGTRRMRDTMQAMQLPAPEFRQEELGNATVRVTLRNSIEQRRAWVDSDVVEVLGTALARTLDDEQKRCVNWAAEHGPLNVSQVQRLTNRSWPSAKKFMEDLRVRGIFEFQHKGGDRDPKSHYVLVGFKSEQT